MQSFSTLMKSFVVGAVLLLLCVPLYAQFDKKDALIEPGVSASAEFLPVEQAYQLVASVAEHRVQLTWSIAPQYFLYRERMQFTAQADATPIPLQITLNQGENKYDELYERETEVYRNTAVATLTLPDVQTGNLVLMAESQGCADAGLCYPPQKQYFNVDLRAGTIAPIEPPTHTAVSASPAVTPPVPAVPLLSWGLIGALVMALLGGVILNLMPCVFPVLSLKVFAMAAQRERDDEAHWHSWIYTAGVITTFVLVASVMLLLRAGGEAVGWGFQLQEPMFVGLLIYLFFVVGLSFSGVLHIGGSLMGIGQRLVAGSPVRATFFTGVLAVVVASPCSAPFMGVALGYAVVQSAPVALLVFAVLGLGMALPFILLAYWPQMLHRLPAPGLWMERLRQFLAFPLYATAVWLLWVLGQQGGELAMVAILGGLILLVLAGWLWRDASVRVWEKALAVLVLATALIVPHFLVAEICQLPQATAFKTGDAEPYSPARLAALRAEGKPALINMTASWCLTCLVNEKMVLSRHSVKKYLHEKNIAYLVGDWTNRDPDITQFLQQYKRNGVPLYVYYPTGVDSKPVVLPQVLTENAVLEALR
ncbi:MAG: protein-disulfide reductase DsbD [Pseudomonadales bacterium]